MTAEIASGRLGRRKRTTALALGAIVVGMAGLSYASVPLYRLYCQITGSGGTTRVAEAAPATASDATMTIRFNADLARGMPWRFYPAERSTTVRVGELTLATFVAENPTGRTITGQATFNVTPEKVGVYFDKTECFCFTKQVLAPGERVEMPVQFFVDPAILADPNMRGIGTITLSYTFFETPESGTN